VDILWATKSEGVALSVRAISFQDFQIVVLIHQRYRRMDGQTTCDRNTALCSRPIVHRAVKRKKRNIHIKLIFSFIYSLCKY